MTSIISALRREAARILDEGLVEVVVGFQVGTLPLKAQPVFIERKEEAEKLVLNGFCQNNLASYLTRLPREQRVGIVCRGCESRAVRALTIEQQREQDTLYVIGVPCSGILDWRKIERDFGERVTQAREDGARLMLTTPAGDCSVGRVEYLHESCARCLHPNPVGADVVLGEPVPEGDRERAFAEVAAFASQSSEERYAAFVADAERCIRCYACREACPMCYCTECFVDHTTPRWAESMISPSGTQAWHIVRAFHQTGRCVSCGACERACPMDIKMTYLTDKLNLDMWEEYGFEVGENEQEQPPLAAFSLDDKQRFVR
jgi:formate dehydrogenase subunit beta